MLNPTPAQILRTIETTLADIVTPAVTDVTARSALATIGHLLRHVVLCVEQGGDVLTRDMKDARALLERLSSYCSEAGDKAQAESIATALAGAMRAPAVYPSLDIMAERAALLRQAVQDVLLHLQARRAERGDDPAYLSVRDDIREYLSRQLAGEAALIHPAFADKGPRR